MIKKRKEVIKLLAHIKKRYKPERMFLFGSWARGDIHRGSDIDLLIIKQTQKRFFDRIEEVLRIYKGKIALEPLVYTPEEFVQMKKRPYLKSILKEAIEI